MTSDVVLNEETSTQHPKWLKWVILFVMSLVVFGSYYVYDAISPMKRAMESELGISPGSFGWLVSFYSLPNMLGITILGGILMDKKGIRFAGMLFVSLSTLGAILTAVGSSEFFRNSMFHTSLNNIIPGWSAELLVMVIGRFLFGFGAEVIIVAQNKVISKWFKDSELAFAFGLNLVVCRFGTFAALNVSSTILDNSQTEWLRINPGEMARVVFHYPGLSLAMWISAIVMLTSFAAFFVYLFFDKTADVSSMDPEDEFKLSDIGDLLANKTFIYITLLCVSFYSAVFPFTSFATDILQNKYGLSTAWAGRLTSLVISSTIIFTPIGGFLIDRFGKRATVMVYGSLLLIIVHLSLGYTMVNPLIPMAILGMAFSLVPAAMWPSVPFLVKEKQLGTAYGFMGLIQNIGLWGVPILIGKITEITNKGVTSDMVRDKVATWNYTPALTMLAGLGVVALILAVMLLRNEKNPKTTTGLELPSKTYQN